MKKLINKKFSLFLIGLFILGFVFGIIYIFLLKDMDKLIIEKEITEYINLINTKDYNYLSAFSNSFKNNLFYIFIIWGSNLLLIFTPLVLFVNLYKGFSLGFTISSYIYIYKFKGLFYSLISLIPHEIINILMIFILSVVSLSFSYKILKIIYKNENINLRVFFKKYILLLIIFIIVGLISSLSEILANSYLMRLILP